MKKRVVIVSGLVGVVVGLVLALAYFSQGSFKAVIQDTINRLERAIKRGELPELSSDLEETKEFFQETLEEWRSYNPSERKVLKRNLMMLRSIILDLLSLERQFREAERLQKETWETLERLKAEVEKILEKLKGD